jgi:hypothetical protein
MLTNLYITESFNLFVQDAELSGTEPYYFGWAWVRLAPTDTSSINPIISEHKAADTIFTVDGTLKPVTMRMAGISAPSDKVLASTLTGTKKPVIAIATDETTGLVYAVQMGTYDWLGLGIMGYDDLILKSIDWASF